jgi:hypothetical protein
VNFFGYTGKVTGQVKAQVKAQVTAPVADPVTDPVGGQPESLPESRPEWFSKGGRTFLSAKRSEKKERGLSSPRQNLMAGWKTRPPLSLFFDDLLDAKVRVFNPRYGDAEGALLGQFRHLHTDIYGNREFVEHLRNRGKFLDHEEKRERSQVWPPKDNGGRLFGFYFV